MVFLMPPPNKITPCPIAEAIFEIRFESSLPSEAIFGVAYQDFKSDFPKMEKLPILQLPEMIRNSDPNLIFSPHYKLVKDNFIIQIGPKVFSLAATGEYCGWEIFSKEILAAYNRISALEVFDTISRCALRYINIFDGLNILDHSTLKLSIGKDDLVASKSNLMSEIEVETCIHTLRIMNETEILLEGGTKKANGSVIDIDTILKEIDNDMNHNIEAAHLAEKELFFSLLSGEFLESLNPEY